MTGGEVQGLYTRRARSYVKYVQAFGHRQGLRAVLASSGLVAPGQRILDAGCGTGLSILAVADALKHRGFEHRLIHGFDFTPAMLELCRATVAAAAIPRVELQQADLVHLDDQLPALWSGYDLIVCASVLEHVPRQLLAASLSALIRRLAPGGSLMIVVTRKLFYFTRWIWHCEGYSRGDIRAAVADAGRGRAVFLHYPWNYAWLNVANHVVEVRADIDPPDGAGQRPTT